MSDIEVPIISEEKKTVMTLQKEQISGAVEVHPDVDSILVNNKAQNLLLFKEALSYI